MKKFFCRILLVLLISGVMCSSLRAEGNAVVRAKSATAAPGQTVRVEIVLENNPGVVCLSVRVNYDASRLTLTDVSDGGILGKAGFAPDKSKIPYQLSWENDLARENFTQDGVLAVLTFAVSPDAPAGETPVTLTVVPHAALTVDLEERAFESADAVITVLPQSAQTPTGMPPTNAAPATDAAVPADTPNASGGESGTAAPGETPRSPQLSTTAPASGIPDEENHDGKRIIPWIVLIAFVLLSAAAAAIVIGLRRRKHD